MDVYYTLTCSLANIHAHIIPIWMVLLINDAFDLVQ